MVHGASPRDRSPGLIDLQSDSCPASLTSSVSWALRDRRSVWHPFTQIKREELPICIVKGKGAYLYSESGKAYLDAISSWMVNLHGYSHPYIAEKIALQMQELEHVMFAGYTHPQAILLAERLLALFSGIYGSVFYSDNGSTAVEVAIKMAFQIAGEGKTLLSFEKGYHGDTFGAMSAAGKTEFNKPFWPYLFQVQSIAPPCFGNEKESWKQFELAINSGHIGAFIFEPQLQGCGGMIPHCTQMLTKMIQACHERNIITIADEVLTGFGRTGPLFVCDTLAVKPDIITLAKGITGGFLPLGATLVKRTIFDAFFAEDPTRTFLHGHSYTGNPLACAAANANLDLLLTPSCEAARTMIQSLHLEFQKTWQTHPQIKRLDVIGTILALEYNTTQRSYHHPIKHRLISFFQSRGIIVRPFGNVLYILPPYCITSFELETIYQAIAETVDNATFFTH